MSPQPFSAPPRDTQGKQFYNTTALIGIVVVFIGPIAALLAGGSSLTAGTIGYTGIVLFAGGVAARYGFAEHASPWIQLAKNLGISLIITSIFFGIFLLL